MEKKSSPVEMKKTPRGEETRSCCSLIAQGRALHAPPPPEPVRRDGHHVRLPVELTLQLGPRRREQVTEGSLGAHTMNDPHVERLVYRFKVTEPNTSFKNPPAVSSEPKPILLAGCGKTGLG